MDVIKGKFMKLTSCIWLSILMLSSVCFLFETGRGTRTEAAESVSFRAPSVPLIVHDPYFSVWSASDTLTESETVHWTGAKYSIHALVRVNGKAYRIMGAEPSEVPAMKQKSVQITATRTIYFFESEEVLVSLTFMSPILPSDLDLLTRPSTYVTAKVSSKTGKPVETAFYFDAGAELAVDKPNQKVNWTTPVYGSVLTGRLGSEDQLLLNRSGDNLRIDWGFLFLSGLDGKALSEKMKINCEARLQVGNGEHLRNQFAQGKKIQAEELRQPIAVEEGKVAIAYECVAEKAAVDSERTVIYAYNDRSSIQYFDKNLLPYWKHGRKVCQDLIMETWDDLLNPGQGRSKLSKPVDVLCAEFDQRMTHDLTKAYGAKYAQVCALAYRHVFGAQKVVADSNGMPLMFSKENFSNGCIGTVDLMYPCSPILLYYCPALMKATLEPIMAYSKSARWKHPFAPHDLGQYPLANGQVYGGGETTEVNQMPVEESGNMLILAAALTVLEGNADYVSLHWKTFTRWAEYLAEKGFDPENQLCTDDFAGHLAHNVNLSAKAIMGLAGYAKMAEIKGEKEVAKKYRDLAEKFTAQWIKEADDGDHYRLAFDRPGTWSMKYNLFWDRILGFDLFPDSVMDKEINYYKTVSKPFGLPLDNRSNYSKNDWILWIAAQTKNRADFNFLFDPFYRFVTETPDRVPISDWYWTDSGKLRGFRARSVIGGFWAPMLRDLDQWRNQAAQGQNIKGVWAVLPPRYVKDKTVVPCAKDQKDPIVWKYTFKKPGKNWKKPDFDDSGWKSGKAGFGTAGTPGARVGTVWQTPEIWLRRTIELNDLSKDLGLFIHHDERVEVFINGRSVFQKKGYTTDYMTFYLPGLNGILKKGKNTIAVSCSQTIAGQYIDLGIVTVKPEKSH